MAVLVCQIYTLPEIQRVIIQNTRDTKALIFFNLITSIYGVWNFDFFRQFIPPICLPLNTMQVIALDYISASSLSAPYPGGFLYASNGT